MISTLIALFSCSSKYNNTPIFPQTDNAHIKIKKLTIPTNQNVVKYIISKDKKKIYVYTFENEDDNSHNPMVGNHLLVFDELGGFEKDIPLQLNSNGGNYDMFYTNTDELVFGSPNNFYFIDIETFTKKNFGSWGCMSYPFRDLNYKKAEIESKEWESEEIKKLNMVYQFKDDEIKVENKRISAEYWTKFREIKSKTPQLIEQKVKEFYFRFVQDQLPNNGETLEGIKTDGYEFVLLPYQNNKVYFDVKGLAMSSKINWKTWRTNTNLNFEYKSTSLNHEGFEAQDRNTLLTCLNTERTSSIKDDFTDKIANDFTMKVQLGTKIGTFKVKDRPIYLAQDAFFATKNGTVVVKYKNEIYLIQ